jgi:hypothetical protein
MIKAIRKDKVHLKSDERILGKYRHMPQPSGQAIETKPEKLKRAGGRPRTKIRFGQLFPIDPHDFPQKFNYLDDVLLPPVDAALDGLHRQMGKKSPKVFTWAITL